ncbi:hypothetical protein GEU84_001210 [Fertoebacter nigrum]|uniref:Uncharacterized protein n=1 Tax=Fertoeibacter niger TaxID=2656921 RepID=A0A8X8KMI0_9RHOB|nr:hypothetical protein [Fertoeibacter niger]NUB42990.1 hypothetical protein [Fertoeibacter niger]
MLYEYAVDPKTVGASWENFRYLIEKFGFDKGRLISWFPGSWCREVFDTAKASDMKTIQLQRVTEKLSRAERYALVRNNRKYRPDLGSWLPNVLSQHHENPFRAIITSENPNGLDVVLLIDDLDEQHPLFSADVSWAAPRSAKGIAQDLRLFLVASKDIVIIDPFIDLRNHGADYTGPLREMFSVMTSAGRTNVKIELHFRTHSSRPPIEIVERDARRWLDGVIPNGCMVELYEWEEDRKLHNRAVLSERGGIASGEGFGVLADEASLDFSLLATSDSDERIRRHRPANNLLKLAQPAVRVDSDGTVKRI